MSAKDIYHDAIKTALIKDGWTILADPYRIKYEDAKLFADLAAERIIAATQNGEKIVVEIKSFISPSPMHDFAVALGQYIMYRDLIALTEPDYQVYLAIRESIFESFFTRQSVQAIVQQNQMRLLVVNVEEQEVVQWTR